MAIPDLANNAQDRVIRNIFELPDKLGEQRRPLAYVFDPFPDMIAWLEGIVRGGYPRLIIDVEGGEVECHLFEAETAGWVRLVMTAAGRLSADGCRVTTLDILATRRTLVAGFYKPLIEFWASESFLASLDHWIRVEDDEALDVAKEATRLRSDVIDRYLAN